MLTGAGFLAGQNPFLYKANATGCQSTLVSIYTQRRNAALPVC